jgi:D-serine dehydratase
MIDESKASRLKEQIDKVEKTISQIPLIIFLTFSIGGAFFGVSIVLSILFGYYWILMVGSIAFLTCMTVSTTIARNAKEEYRKLIEQLKE